MKTQMAKETQMSHLATFKTLGGGEKYDAVRRENKTEHYMCSRADYRSLVGPIHDGTHISM